MDMKKKKRILDFALIAVFLPILVGYIVAQTWIMLISCALAVGWAILHHSWWRCPHCGENLGRYDMKISYCPHCGEKINLDGE